MTKHNVLYILPIIGLMASCQSDDDLAVQLPDSAREITFSTNAEKINTRAGEVYEDYDNTKHPTTMGVFGYHGLSAPSTKQMFYNQEVEYKQSSLSSVSKWEYTPLQYWGEYVQSTSFDFFAYMPHNADATLTASVNSYTLSIPVDLSEKNGILTESDLKEAPLLCNLPIHKSTRGEIIEYKMDQTLTGYNIQFQLGEKMDNVRDFKITSVKVYGNNLPVGGTVSRTYTLNGSTWTAGDVTWGNELTIQDIAEPGVSISISSKTVTVNTHTDWVKWGDKDKVTDGAFFAIPSESFNPTIEVTYDVEANDDNNADGSTITRKDVKSTIILNSDNFTGPTKGTVGKIHPIKIKIVPNYLYVLSDDDQSTGFLVVNNQAQQ